MKPLHMTHTTAILGAPDKWDKAENGPCVGLPVTELGAIKLSYWRASWRDRLAILVGRPIRLAVIAENHPPVMLDTEKF